MSRNTATASLVVEAAMSLQKRGQEPSIRNVIAELGFGSPNNVGKLLREWKESLTPAAAQVIELDGPVTEAITRQIVRVANEAAATADGKAKRAEDDVLLLTVSCQRLEEQLLARQAELGAANERVQQQAGQLEERLRELDALRGTTAADIAESRAVAATERGTAEELRQQLVRATLRLEAMPRLEKALEEREQMLKAASDELAQACQRAAVAQAQLESQQQRTLETGQREGKLRDQVVRLEADLARAWDLERALRVEVQQLTGQVATAQGRCTLLEAQLKQLIGRTGLDADKSSRAAGQEAAHERESVGS